MKIKKWVWRLHCERCFEIYVSKEPQLDEEMGRIEGPASFGADLEIQLGKQSGNSVYAECPYDGCDGDLLDFWWWDEFRNDHPNTPEVPQDGVAYPLYPELSK